MITVDEARAALESARLMLLASFESYSEVRATTETPVAVNAARREVWRLALLEFMQAEIALCAAEDFDRLPVRAFQDAALR